jgi:hypothetical protein
MCNLDAGGNLFAPQATLADPPPTCAPPSRGSRRRRLWELDDHAHCPVLGVCLPIGALRRTVDKALGGNAVADDYELHRGAVAQSKQRSQVAEALQKALEQRAAKAKTTDALTVWWQEAAASKQVAGALWAVLTHPRCTSDLERRVLGDVHMLQHQVGMASRVDAARLEMLIDENAVLARELAAAQQRCARHAAAQSRLTEQHQATIVRLRGELAGRETLLAQERERLQALEDAAPGLARRFELTRENRHLLEQVHELQRSVLRWRQEAERQERRAEAATAELALPGEAAADRGADSLRARVTLHDRAVLCVGGRLGSVPFYRRIIEGTGGRFLHHDGGDEDSTARLESTLAAADLVICQTGCISHDAYWRVKDHCKRTGKRCVFVQTPSRAGLVRALAVMENHSGEDDA